MAQSRKRKVDPVLGKCRPGPPVHWVKQAITLELKKQLSSQEAIERMAKGMIASVSEGNAGMAKIILDRLEGPIIEKVELSGSLLSEDERAARIAAILDAGRDRRDRPAS